MIINIEQNKNKQRLEISYYDTEGRTKIRNIDIPDNELYSWKECKENDRNAHPKVRAWNNKPVKKLPRKTLSKHRIYEFLQSLPESETEGLYDLNYPNVGFVDIEVWVPEEGVSDFDTWCKETPTPIITLSVVSQSNKAIVLGTKPLTISEQSKIEIDINKEFTKHGKEYSFKYIQCKNELELLHMFFLKIVPKFGLLTGWNFIKFDWQYLINRYVKLGGDPSDCSPTNTMNYKGDIPSHIAVFDYASIFARWDRSIKVKENNTLDFVSESILGVNKVHHSESLNELYEKDYERFVRYNVVDSILVHMINEKSKLLDLLFTISNICKITIYQADMPTVIGDALLSAGFSKEDKVITSGFEKPPEREKYEGAYVKKPIPGYYDWVAAFDFASLYPTTMRQFNISPESFVGMIEHNVPEPIWDKMSKEERKKKYEEEAIKHRDDKSKIYCDNGAIFDKKDSVLKVILTDLYGERKVYKKKMLQRKHDIDQLEREIKELEKTI